MTDEHKTEQDAPKGERIAKMLARAGVGSRRAVERMIEAGMVKIDGKVIDTPAMLITSVEGITVDGMVVKEPEPPRLWKYHKVAGRVTSYHDPEDRPTVFQALPENMPRVISVGRLDMNTEGLLLLTNDGGLARWLELPETGWVRTYKVRVYGRLNKRAVREIEQGTTIDGVVYRPVEIKLEDHPDRSNQWLTVSIREGKNREVRKLLEYAGVQVTRLIRLSYGPLELGKLGRGEVVELNDMDLKKACRDYFIAQGIDPDELPEEKPKSKPAPKSGWAKAKPKKNPRRANKRKMSSDQINRKKNRGQESKNKPARKPAAKPQKK